MSEAIENLSICPACGGRLLAGSNGALCPACMLQAALADDPAAESGSPRDSLGEQPGAKIGRYKLLERIGEGGFGIVWMALELRSGQPVTLAPGGSKEFVISELKCGNRDSDRWLVTRPEDYQISANFRTRTMADKAGEIPARHLDPQNFDSSLSGYEVLTTSSNPVVLKVTE